MHQYQYIFNRKETVEPDGAQRLIPTKRAREGFTCIWPGRGGGRWVSGAGFLGGRTRESGRETQKAPDARLRSCSVGAE